MVPLILVHLGVQLARRVLARGRSADQRQQIDGIAEVALDREATRHVLEMRVEAAILVDDQHDRTLSAGPGAGEIAVDPALGRVEARRSVTSRGSLSATMAAWA
jgi:hypothetical protein